MLESEHQKGEAGGRGGTLVRIKNEERESDLKQKLKKCKKLENTDGGEREGEG